MWQPDLYLQTHPKIVFYMLLFSFETNLNFSKRRIMLSILGCLSYLNTASLSKWRYKKKFTWFLIINHLLFVKHRNCAWKFKSIDIWNYVSVKRYIEFNLFKKKEYKCIVYKMNVVVTRSPFKAARSEIDLSEARLVEMIYTNLDYNDYKINHNREYCFIYFLIDHQLNFKQRINLQMYVCS